KLKIHHNPFQYTPIHVNDSWFITTSKKLIYSGTERPQKSQILVFNGPKSVQRTHINTKYNKLPSLEALVRKILFLARRSVNSKGVRNHPHGYNGIIERLVSYIFIYTW
ncbi:hypothetical protein ACJX0J_022581, partial [Zea mays]